MTINPTSQSPQILSTVNQLMIFFAQSALANRDLLTTMLFHSGVHLDKTHHRGWSPATLKYRGDSISLLKNRLCSNDEKNVDDTTIAMVAFLGAAGVCCLKNKESSTASN